MRCQIVAVGYIQSVRITCPGVSTVGDNLHITHHQAVVNGRRCIEPAHEAATARGLLAFDTAGKHAVRDSQLAACAAYKASVGAVTIHIALDGHVAHHVADVCSAVGSVTGHRASKLVVGSQRTLQIEVLHCTAQQLYQAGVLSRMIDVVLDGVIVAVQRSTEVLEHHCFGHTCDVSLQAGRCIGEAIVDISAEEEHVTQAVDVYHAVGIYLGDVLADGFYVKQSGMVGLGSRVNAIGICVVECLRCVHDVIVLLLAE